MRFTMHDTAVLTALVFATHSAPAQKSQPSQGQQYVATQYVATQYVATPIAHMAISRVMASHMLHAGTHPGIGLDAAILGAMSDTLRIPVATHDLPRGTVLTSADIAWIIDSANVSSGMSRARSVWSSNRTNKSTTNTRIAEPSVVVPGWIARRPVRAGELLTEPAVGRPDLVATGDPVDVVYYDEGIVIKLRGIAIGSGAKGDEVYVKLDNRRRLRGIVESAATIRIL